MATQHPSSDEPGIEHETHTDRDVDEWIDETMAEGDVANGEGDPDDNG